MVNQKEQLPDQKIRERMDLVRFKGRGLRHLRATGSPAGAEEQNLLSDGFRLWEDDDRREGFARLEIIVTVELDNEPEVPMFAGRFSATDSRLSVLAMAKRCVLASLEASKVRKARIRQYLDHSLVAKIDFAK